MMSTPCVSSSARSASRSLAQAAKPQRSATSRALKAAGREYRSQVDTGVGPESRQQGGSGKIAGADERKADAASLRRSRGRAPDRSRLGRYGDQWGTLHTTRILEKHPDRSCVTVPQRRVRFACTLDLEPVGGEGSDLDAPRREKPQELLHVATLGPTDVAVGVVEPLLLVGGVIASRAVGARNAKRKLPFVIRRTGNRHADVADDDHSATVPGNLPGQPNGVAALGPGGYEHAIKTQPPRELGTPFCRTRSAACVRPVCSQPARQVALGALDVDAGDFAPGSQRYLRDKLSDETETDHGDTVAQGHAREANTLHGDGTDCRVCRVGQVEVVGNARAEVLRHVENVGMVGVARAPARHAVAGAQTLHQLADVTDHARSAVAQRARFFEPSANRAIGRENAITARLVDDLPCHVRSAARLANQTLPPKLDFGRLRPRADEGVRRSHECATGLQRGRRRLDDGDRAILQRLCDLPHVNPPPSGTAQRPMQARSGYYRRTRARCPWGSPVAASQAAKTPFVRPQL